MRSQLADHVLFVRWFRQAAPYINAHRGRTFVILFGGEVVQDPAFPHLIHDIVLLSPLGYSPTGEVFNLHAAAALQADRLLCLVEGPGLLEPGGALSRELTLDQAEERSRAIGFPILFGERAPFTGGIDEADSPGQKP